MCKTNKTASLPFLPGGVRWRVARWGGVCVLMLTLYGCYDPVVKPVRAFPKDVVYYTAEGGVVIWKGDMHCVAPPAQAARMTDVAASGEVESQSGSQVTVGLGGALSTQREVAELYSQGQGNLFLQFALYRLCEMHLNGAIDGAQYAKLYKEVLELSKELVEKERELEEAREKSLEAELKKELYE